MSGVAELVHGWRQGVLDLVEDLAVVEGALVELDGEQVPKVDSLRWIERARSRLQLLAEHMSHMSIPNPEEENASDST